MAFLALRALHAIRMPLSCTPHGLRNATEIMILDMGFLCVRNARYSLMGVPYALLLYVLSEFRDVEMKANHARI